VIYDCVLFRNEFELLEIRLHELAPYVDRFVLVEGPITFQGNPKPLYFDESDRFQEFPITHIIASSERKDDPWANEEHQRNAILYGLKEAGPDDIVLFGDVDEIPRGDKIPEAVERIEPGTDRLSFSQELCFYHLNARSTTDKWLGTQAMRRSYLQSPGMVRAERNSDHNVIPGGGIHACNMGDVDWLISKMESFSHTEVNTPEYKDPDFLAKCIREHREVTGRDDLEFEVLDPEKIWLPEYVRENRKRFAHLFAEVEVKA
jgi:beta-1,4-mannosyl-glycoprotein beta-1,4-N-acetylglucosaminyltransferase